jgi:hypothetical protein
MAVLATGCATVEKRFTVIVEPPDAVITVIPGGDGPERKFSSPADVTVSIPTDPDLAAASRVEVTRELYKPKTVSIAGIEEGYVMRIKLEKLVHYLLKFRLLAPAPSDDLRYRDREIAAAFTPGERQFDLDLTNYSGKTIRILWDRAEYTDYVNKQHRIMHSGVRPQDRNNAIPPETVQPGGSVQRSIMPVSAVVYSKEKKGYDTKPLFPVDNDRAVALKGRRIYLFLPIEVDRAIIPYNFKFEISEVTKEQ